jgi:hypothetical protein
MPKYRISFTTEDLWRLDVEANTIDEAMENFYNGDYTHDMAVLTEGGYLQESVSIEPMEG